MPESHCSRHLLHRKMPFLQHLLYFLYSRHWNYIPLPPSPVPLPAVHGDYPVSLWYRFFLQNGLFFQGQSYIPCLQNPHNIDQFFPIKIVPDRFCHLVGCSGIVSAVYNKKRLFIDNRKSSLPACVEKTDRKSVV